jgi:hypothetical protein
VRSRGPNPHPLHQHHVLRWRRLQGRRGGERRMRGASGRGARVFAPLDRQEEAKCVTYDLHLVIIGEIVINAKWL